MPDSVNTSLIPHTGLSLRQRILIWLGPIDRAKFSSFRDIWTYGESGGLEELLELVNEPYIANTLSKLDYSSYKHRRAYFRRVSTCAYEEINSKMHLTNRDCLRRKEESLNPELLGAILFFLTIPVSIVIAILLVLKHITSSFLSPIHFSEPVEDNCLEGKRPKKGIISSILKLFFHSIILTPFVYLIQQTFFTVDELLLKPRNTFKKFLRFFLETKEEQTYRAETQIVSTLKEVSVLTERPIKGAELLELLNKLQPIQIESAMESVELASWILESLKESVSFVNGGCERQKALLRGVEKQQDPIKTGLKLFCDLIGMTTSKLTDAARNQMIQDSLKASSQSSSDARNLLCIFKNSVFIAASLEQRKIYSNGQARSVYQALLTQAQTSDLNLDQKQMLTALFKGFTGPEKQLAMTPPGQDTPNNSPLIDAATNNNRGELIEWLRTMGVDTGANPNGRIAGNQDVHNRAVHKTVSDSLNALKNSSRKLNTRQLNEALQSLKTFAETLPDAPDSNEEDAVVRRALERLLSAFYSGVHDEDSGVTAQEILGHFWHYYQKQSDEDKQISLVTFKGILFTIQRGYNKDTHGPDNSICGSGTVNQLTIGLQAVLPDVIWVEVMDRNRLTLIALNWIAKNLDNVYKQASQNIQSSCRNEISMSYTGVVPNALWSALENDLRKHLIESLHNDALNRDCVDNPQNEINGLFAQLKSGNYSFTTEMLRTHKSITDMLHLLKRDASHPNPERFRAIHNLDKPNVANEDDEDDELQSARPVLVQYHLMREPKNNIGHEAHQAYRLIKTRNAYKIALSEDTIQSLPDSFKALAQNEDFMQELVTRIEQKVQRLKMQGKPAHPENVTVALDDILPNTIEKAELLKALEVLKPGVNFSIQTLENDLLERSPTLFGAWLTLSEVPADAYKKAAGLCL